MFVTVNELVGLPGLPGTQQGIRGMMNKRTADAPTLVRKRQGTKALNITLTAFLTLLRKRYVLAR
jgi:hypothetical protein